MGPKTVELVTVLNEMVALLRNHGEVWWANWLDNDNRRIVAGDFHGITHLLSAFGGMGSLNDLVLDPINGHDIEESDVPAVNQRFQTLKARCYVLADAIKRTAVIDETE
jgi:hypothetical protein